ncbi:hypothetical protein CWM42_15455 [Escherichia coli]|nr:hypothetical protein CWM42_15455 [Escherichia coli]
MDSVHHIWCPLFSQEFQDLPDGAETTLTSILRQQKLLRERIDETLSEEIVQKCRNINGEYVWPWILPFSAAGMKHSSIQHQ